MIDQTQQGKKKKVVVAMSGGVDSSVAAALMVEQGYEVIGLMMRLWSEDGKEMDNRCCTPEQMDDARQIAGNLGIPFYVVDVKDYFKETIVDFYLNEHSRGRTPNPCIECNREIRFNWLYERAMALNADYLVTGHYAQVKTAGTGHSATYELHTGIDTNKDQSYVLHMLDQEHLAHVQFPVGGYTKPEVRELARKFNLPVASKGDSMDLCFLSGEDYRNFLSRHVPEINRPGPIFASNGEQLGEHTGLPNYTIGQRKGLGVSSPQPLFVLRKDATDNALILGTRADVVADELTIRNVSWVAGSPPDAGGFAAEVKIRYKARAVPATIYPKSDNSAQIQFNEPVFGATPGQGAVFYQGANCLGGGLISDF
ncbi:MAG: tRNA 2-thiouridine(34) synthase MnmA [Anaerolineae bacterium]